MNNFIYLITNTSVLTNGEEEQVLAQKKQLEVLNQVQLSDSLKGMANNQHLAAAELLAAKDGWWEQSFEQSCRLIAFGSTEPAIVPAQELPKSEADTTKENSGEVEMGA